MTGDWLSESVRVSAWERGTSATFRWFRVGVSDGSAFKSVTVRAVEVRANCSFGFSCFPSLKWISCPPPSFSALGDSARTAIGTATTSHHHHTTATHHSTDRQLSLHSLTHSLPISSVPPPLHCCGCDFVLTSLASALPWKCQLNPALIPTDPFH